MTAEGGREHALTPLHLSLHQLLPSFCAAGGAPLIYRKITCLHCQMYMKVVPISNSHQMKVSHCRQTKNKVLTPGVPVSQSGIQPLARTRQQSTIAWVSVRVQSLSKFLPTRVWSRGSLDSVSSVCQFLIFSTHLMFLRTVPIIFTLHGTPCIVSCMGTMNSWPITTSSFRKVFNKCSCHVVFYPELKCIVQIRIGG